MVMVLLLLVGASIAGAPRSSGATTIIVNSAADVAADDGTCTLREAIVAVNSHNPSGVMPGECAAGSPGLDAIAFDIPGSGVKTIALNSALPALTKPAFIAGYTQPGSSPNTLAAGNNAVLLIEIDGTNAGPGAYAFRLASGSTVRGLVINRFQSDASGNGGSGFLLQSVTGCVIAGNFIGTNAAGTVALNNGGVGIFALDGAANHVIGGTDPGDRNVISGNLHGGIILGNAGSTGNLIQGNYIGTNADGTAALPNSGGIIIDGADGNTIGGTDARARNLISGNFSSGVDLENASSGNVIRGNIIGATASGTSPLPNTSVGVSIFSGFSGAPSNHTIGGITPGAGNIIAFNNGPGVTIQSGQGFDPIGDAILGNSIFSNTAIGIDLGGDGVTPNDTGDGDMGPNRQQNFPVLTSAGVSASGTQIQGTLSSTPLTTFRLEFFAIGACDPSGNGEGQILLGSAPVTTDGNGTAAIDVQLPALATNEQFVTATATDASNNTSEFSPCVAVSGATQTELVAAVLPGSRSVPVGAPATAFATVINAGTVPGLACGISAATPVAAVFGYQTTDAATNMVTGTPNTPVSIAPGGSQSYVVILTPHAAFPPADVAMSFQCLNSAPAPVTVGLDTLLLSASKSPVPDVIALVATPSGDGILNIPVPSGIAAFAVATANVGSGGVITVTADTGGAGLPVALSLCETHSITGACINPAAPAASVTTAIGAGATPTFGIFVQALGPVAFSPAINRVFVRFKDSGNVTRGATSVAVRTQ
jgi:CSLREA domain-containing protein